MGDNSHPTNALLTYAIELQHSYHFSLPICCVFARKPQAFPEVRKSYVTLNLSREIAFYHPVLQTKGEPSYKIIRPIRNVSSELKAALHIIYNSATKKTVQLRT
jgi:hypothetical protein